MDDKPRTDGTSRMAQWGRRLETTKITPGIVVMFIAFLGAVCAVAAGIGYIMHHLPRR